MLLMCRVAHNEATLTAHGETTSRVIKASTQDSATQILLQIKCKFYLKTHTRVQCSLAEKLSRLWGSRPHSGIVPVSAIDAEQCQCKIFSKMHLRETEVIV